MTREQALAIYRTGVSERDLESIRDSDLANLAAADPAITPVLEELQAARDHVEDLHETISQMEE